MGLLTRASAPTVTAPTDAVEVPDHQLDIAGVSMSYGRSGPLVLRDVSLAVERGELVSLLGPSGCGKTTLLRLVAGFLSPDRGSIRIGGVDTTRLPAHRRSIGMVHQNYALWPHMTVAENVGFGLEMRRVSRPERVRRIGELLELVGLSGFESRLANQLSGGQQQRVSLARALVIRPDVLLLDEPLAALDANLRHQLQRHIRDIQQQLGVTTIMVTHDREEAMAVSDRIVVLDGGDIVQAADAETLYTAPATPFVLTFTGEANLVAGRVEDKAGDRYVVSSALGRVALPLTEPHTAEIGDPVLIGFRPEAVRLSEDNPHDAAISVACDHLDAAFLGSSRLHRVQLGSDTVLCRRPSAFGSLRCDPDSVVHLSLDADALHLFPADSLPTTPIQEDQ
ncbi:MAG: ABC transporter ATP-binding protein [Acidimicrobiales bacterium]